MQTRRCTTRAHSTRTGNSEEVQSDSESASSGSEVEADASKPQGFFILQHRNATENIKALTDLKLKVR